MEFFVKNWLPIFAKHQCEEHPEPDVEAFLLRFGHPNEKQSLAPLTQEDILYAVRKFATDGAGGLDGWSPLDLKRLSPKILGLLIHLFDAVEAHGRWPDELCWAGIALIPNREGGNPLDVRPITVTQDMGSRQDQTEHDVAGALDPFWSAWRQDAPLYQRCTYKDLRCSGGVYCQQYEHARPGG